MNYVFFSLSIDIVVADSLFWGTVVDIALDDSEFIFIVGWTAFNIIHKMMSYIFNKCCRKIVPESIIACRRSRLSILHGHIIFYFWYLLGFVSSVACRRAEYYLLCIVQAWY